MEAPFKIESREGHYVLRHNHLSVVIIPYTVDNKDLLDEIGVVTEKHPYMIGGYYTGAATGTVEDDDETLLNRAQQELTEETGYEIPDDEKWIYLGEFSSKITASPVYGFAVDVTGQTRKTPETDGSIQEKGIKFEMLPINKLIDISDTLLQACFFKLFSKKYKQHFL